jgi:8-oxo-dGTP diphosphatase
MAHATAAVAVVLDGRGNVLLVRTNYGTRAFQLPGGLVEPGERPAEAAVRETREETGLLVRIAACIGRYEFGSPLRLVGFAYLCEIEAETPVAAAHEIADVGWHPTRALPQPMGNILPVAIADALAGARDVTRTDLPWHP